MATIKAYTTQTGRRYRVRYRKPDGSQTDKRGFKTKRDAELFAASTTVSKARGEYVDPTAARATIGNLAPDWLANKKHALKPSAYAPLATAWRVYVEPRWATTAVGDIRPSAVEQWVRELTAGDAVSVRKRKTLADKPRSASVVLRAFGVLAGILDVAERDGRVARNAARGATNLPKKASKKRRRYLTDEEAFRLAAAAPNDTRSALILVMAYTGLRWGETVALRVHDLHMLRRRIAVTETATEVEGFLEIGPPKSWEARSVPFPAFLSATLARQCEGKPRSGLVFGDDHGLHQRRPDTSSTRQSWWTATVKAAGLETLTPHDLRHTAASLAVSAGANVKAVQRMLGHKSAAMTLDTYADLFDDDLDEVAERLDTRARENVGEMWAETASGAAAEK